MTREERGERILDGVEIRKVAGRAGPPDDPRSRIGPCGPRGFGALPDARIDRRRDHPDPLRVRLVVLGDVRVAGDDAGALRGDRLGVAPLAVHPDGVVDIEHAPARAPRKGLERLATDDKLALEPHDVALARVDERTRARREHRAGPQRLGHAERYGRVLLGRRRVLGDVDAARLEARDELPDAHPARGDRPARREDGHPHRAPVSEATLRGARASR